MDLREVSQCPAEKDHPFAKMVLDSLGGIDSSSVMIFVDKCPNFMLFLQAFFGHFETSFTALLTGLTILNVALQTSSL